MKYFILFTLIGLICFAGSKDKAWRSVSVNRIKSGQELDKASEQTFQYFFDSRMHCTDKKWGPWGILLTTDSFIYFGHLIDTATVQFFSKVRTDEVMTRFPLCLTVDGDSVINVAKRIVAQKYPQGPQWDVTGPIAYRDNGILVKLVRLVSSPVWYNEERTRTSTDSLLLSKTDLSIIQ